MSAIISATGLDVQFPGCHALDQVDLQVNQGTVYALLGENGAGKTTLIKVLTGFQRPNAGECKVLGLDPLKDAQELRRRIGYVSDSPALYDWMRVEEIGWFASSFYDEDFFERYRELIARYELPKNRKIKSLSKGQRAKVALGLALAHDPDLLILDEPTSGLDPLVRREFLESMLDRVATGRTVLLSSHQISEVERVADEVGIIHQGQFCVQQSLTELRDSVSEVVISLDDPLTALPTLEAPARVLFEDEEGRQRRLVIRGLTAELQAKLENRPGVNSVRVRNATLDEIFVAYTRSLRKEKSNSKISTSELTIAPGMAEVA